ncbi:MAG: hypothetical protein ABUL68_03960 [Pseudomonadota bacterium]
MLKKIFLLLLATGLIATGCRWRSTHAPRYVSITDATREQFFTLTSLGDHRPPSSARLRVTGKIGSPATLVVLLNGRPHHTLQLPAGTVDAEWHGDWYSNQMSLHYLPGAMKSGALQITYEFSG